MIGELYSDAIVASDPDGDVVDVRVSDGPIGFSPTVNSRGTITGFDWRPNEPGEWYVQVTATDPDGLPSTATLRLVGRAARSTPLVLAMGDSIAAGFGRDRTDFFGTDDCFRSESDAYATLTTKALKNVGALSEDSRVLLVGCANTTLALLDTQAVPATTASGDRWGEERTQMAWATSLNPTIITLTVGGEDGWFYDVERLFVPEPGSGEARRVEENVLATAHEEVRIGLEEILDELLTTTDAHIAITTYYDPTASVPVGVDGCEAECFVAAMASVVSGLNDAIVGAANVVSTERISIVNLEGANDVWEASNGAGPDFVRDGLGPLQGIVDRFTGGSSAACADEGRPPTDLVSSLDCLHPNSKGHAKIAERVTSVLLSI